MPPFDPFNGEGLLATMIRLSNERDQTWRFTKKGDRRPAYDIEATKQGRAKAVQAKRDAAAERILASNKAKAAASKPAPGMDIASRMLRAMEPGQWYGMGDLVRLIGASREARGKVHQVLVKQGWVEAARNPAYSGRRYSPDEIEAGAEPEPERLYRLTEVGMARRDQSIHLASS